MSCTQAWCSTTLPTSADHANICSITKVRKRYRREAGFRAELDYACGRGVPLSVFRGREFVDGEPLWTTYDYEVATAWQIEQDLKCPGHGGPRDESWVSSPEQQLERERQVRARLVKCVDCAVMQAAQDRHTKKKNHDRHGIYTVLEYPDL